MTEDYTLWYLGTWCAVAVDCLGDSIIASAPDTFGTRSVNDACACPEDRRIYTGSGGWTAWSVNMDKPGEVRALHEQIPVSNVMHFINIPRAHKAYWTVDDPHEHLFVIDTRTSTLVDSLWLSGWISGMCLDHTGNFVYCAVEFSPVVEVIDARVDSIVANVDLPPMEAAETNPLVLNRATGRIYEAQTDVYTSGNEIPVIRDSIVSGVQELTRTSPSRFVGPTVVRRGSPIRVSTRAELWDVAGRRAAALKVGLNNIEWLAPGVYFVREEPQAPSCKPQAVRKIVVTR